MMIICEGAFSGIEGIIYFIYVSFNKIIDSLPGVMFVYLNKKLIKLTHTHFTMSMKTAPVR